MVKKGRKGNINKKRKEKTKRRRKIIDIILQYIIHKGLLFASNTKVILIRFHSKDYISILNPKWSNESSQSASNTLQPSNKCTIVSKKFTDSRKKYYTPVAGRGWVSVIHLSFFIECCQPLTGESRE